MKLTLNLGIKTEKTIKCNMKLHWIQIRFVFCYDTEWSSGESKIVRLLLCLIIRDNLGCMICNVSFRTQIESKATFFWLNKGKEDVLLSLGI